MRDSVKRMRAEGPILAGLIILSAFFGGFVGWAAIAPLQSAAIAPGEVVVESNRKKVQHLEGGIVDQIMVKEGDSVKAGQHLIRLEQTQPRAALNLIRGRILTARTQEARLIAERDDAKQIEFPPEVIDAANEPDVRKAIEGQRRIFEVRRSSIANQVAILRKRNDQIREEIVGLQAQINADNQQLKLIDEEIGGVEILVRKGLAPKPKLLALQRRSVEIQGGRGSNIAAIARARQNIAETEIKVSDLVTNHLREVVDELRNVQAQLYDLSDRLSAARDVLRRTEIRAPISGRVVNLRVATVGGVIGPGDPLMEIVPSADKLVIDAKVRPDDIDIVHEGQKAQVSFSALNSRYSRPVDGKVTSISADRLINERTGEAYYLARVTLEGLKKEDIGGVDLYPGMLAEVMIVTGARTALQYFFAPIERSLDRAFREQ